MTAALRELLKEARAEIMREVTGAVTPHICLRIDAALAEPAPEPIEDTGPRKIGGPFIPHELARNARNAASGKPILYLCPAGCGCTWRDNDDGSMSLGLRQRSCEVCEFLPLDKLVPLYFAPPPASPDARDAERLDWLEDEMRKEKIAIFAGKDLPRSLFRRNEPITRAAIDAAMLETPTKEAT